MNEADLLDIVGAANGDLAQLALALVDITFGDEGAADCTELRAALEAAAATHWVTPAILAVLLAADEARAAWLLARLRRLSILEGFPARGEGACNVHEATRLALTHRLARDGRLCAFAERAVQAFNGTGAAERIERAYHLAIARPQDGSAELVALDLLWGREGCVEERQALAAVCEELYELPHLAPSARAAALLTLAACRYHELASDRNKALATEALALLKAQGDTRLSAEALGLVADAANKMGETAVAKEAYEEALRLRRTVVTYSDDVPLTAETAVAMWELFHALRDCYEFELDQDRVDAARQLHMEAARIVEPLVAFEPDNASFLYASYISKYFLAQLELSCGYGDVGRRLHEEALAMARRLIAGHPRNTLFQQAVYVSLFVLGEIERGRSCLAEAKRLHRSGLDAAECLANHNPANATWQGNIAFSLNRLGEIALAKHRVGEAREFFRRELEIERRLFQFDAANASLRGRLSDTLTQLGQLAESRGQLAEALATHREALGVARELHALDESDAYRQRSVSIALVFLGDAMLGLGNLDEALDAYSEALEIDRKLAAPDASRAAWAGDQCNLSIALTRLARVYQLQGNTAEAVAFATSAMELMRSLVQQNPEYADARRELTTSLERLGRLALEEGRLEDARRMHEEQLEIRRGLVAAETSQITDKVDLVSALTYLGDVDVSQGKLDAARARYSEALTIAEAVVADDRSFVPGVRSLFEVQLAMSKLSARLGASYESDEWLERARLLVSQVLEADPDRAEWQADARKLARRLAGASE